MGQSSSQVDRLTSPVRVIVVGAGCRGETNSMYAIIHPEVMKVVAVAEPRKFARNKLKNLHKIVNENTFKDWHDVVKKDKFADVVFICTQDRLHKEPAVAFAKKGYHVLLEKPMATSADDCKAIVEACNQSGVMLCVTHVYRYHPVINKIKELIDAGVVGDVIHIQHHESVGFWHFAHSYVRGNWRNEAESSFSLLTKSCHDIDIIQYWVGARRCVKVSSFGSVSHFQKQNKPKGAADRCLDCSIEKDCPYSACRIYLDKVKQGLTGWPVCVTTPNSIPDIESVTEALRTGPYGRCVYECDNDVCSNQVVNMEFEGGLTAAFTMMAFTHAMGIHKTAIYGSKGELSCIGHKIQVFDFLTQKTTEHLVHCPTVPFMNAHGGADYHLMDAFIPAVANNDPSLIRTGSEETLRSHLLVFEAERSRLESRVVYCGDADQSSKITEH